MVAVWNNGDLYCCFDDDDDIRQRLIIKEAREGGRREPSVASTSIVSTQRPSVPCKMKRQTLSRLVEGVRSDWSSN